jgi:hypothetical protein
MAYEITYVVVEIGIAGLGGVFMTFHFSVMHPYEW